MEGWKVDDEGKLIKLLDSGLVGRKEALTMLYTDAELKKLIFAFLLKKGACSGECETIFCDSLVAFVQKGGTANFVYPDKLGSYLIGIAKFLFYRIKRLEKKEERLEHREKDQWVDSPEITLLGKEKRQQVLFLLNVLDEACRKTIHLWAQDFSMKEIAEKLGYKTAAVVRKKKHLCLKKLMNILKDKTELRQRLLEIYNG